MASLRSGSRGAAGGALVAALCVALAGSACGRGDEGARPKAGASHSAQAPNAVPESVTQAERALEATQREVAARKEAVEAAKRAVGDAEKQAVAAAEAVAEAKRTAALGSDTALFRAVQTRLLEDPALASVAISARVQDGAVTLAGRVPDAALRDRAVAVARETPGVRAVENEIEVAD